MFIQYARVGAASAALAMWLPTLAMGQTAPAVPTVPPTPAGVESPAPDSPPVNATQWLVPEGTEMTFELLEPLSSKSAIAGDAFTIRLSEPVDLGDGLVIPAGFIGRGEVTSARPSGRVGRGGELNVRLNYVRIGDKRIPLRGNRAQDGKGRAGASLGLALAVSPLFLLMKGKNIEIPAGYSFAAFTDTNASLPAPLPVPPKG